MTSLALLQQGQRTQRETNQYNIECESGSSLMQGDVKRKKERTHTKGKWNSKEREERRTEIKKGENRQRGMTGEAKGRNGGRDIQREIASHG